MKALQKQVGEKIKQLREQHGLSQEALAAACNLHRTYVGLIERGERNLSLTTIEAIATGLEVPVAEIFQGLSQATALAPKRTKVTPPTLSDMAAQIATIRQILIESKIADAKRFEAAGRRIRPS